MGRNCIVAGCNIKESNCGPLGLRLIGIPAKKVDIWLRAVDREDLLAKGLVHAAKNYKICTRHFDRKYFMAGNLSKLKYCLKQEAVPCLVPTLEPDLQEQHEGELPLPDELPVLPNEDPLATGKHSQPLVPQIISRIEEHDGEPVLPEELSVLPNEDISATGKRSQPLVPSLSKIRIIPLQAKGSDMQDARNDARNPDFDHPTAAALSRLPLQVIQPPLAVEQTGDVKKLPEDILGAWCSATDHLILSLLSAESGWVKRPDLLRKELPTRISSLAEAAGAILGTNGGKTS